MNPFELEGEEGKYSDFSFNQFKGLRVGESKEMNVGSRGVKKFRLALYHAVNNRMPGARFRSKIAHDGSFWVKRIW